MTIQKLVSLKKLHLKLNMITIDALDARKQAKALTKWLCFQYGLIPYLNIIPLIVKHLRLMKERGGYAFKQKTVARMLSAKFVIRLLKWKSEE